jgi:hypothetical protein
MIPKFKSKLDDVGLQLISSIRSADRLHPRADAWAAALDFQLV